MLTTDGLTFSDICDIALPSSDRKFESAIAGEVNKGQTGAIITAAKRIPVTAVSIFVVILLYLI
jgi:hypothetical protein